jgi:hypothetical protein
VWSVEVDAEFVTEVAEAVTRPELIEGITVPVVEMAADRLKLIWSPESVIAQADTVAVPELVISAVVKVAGVTASLKVTVNCTGVDVVGSACPTFCSTVTVRAVAEVDVDVDDVDVVPEELPPLEPIILGRQALAVSINVLMARILRSELESLRIFIMIFRLC